MPKRHKVALIAEQNLIFCSQFLRDKRFGMEDNMEKSMKVNGKEYEIIKLLGKGKGGYSYLASDGEKKYVCSN